MRAFRILALVAALTLTSCSKGNKVNSPTSSPISPNAQWELLTEWSTTTNAGFIRYNPNSLTSVGTILIIGTSDGFLRSSDEGRTLVPGGSSFFSGFFAKSGTTLYSTGGRGAAKSTDGFASYSILFQDCSSKVSAEDSVVLFINSYAYGAPQSLMRSSDGGITLNTIATPVPLYKSNEAIKRGSLILLASGGKLYRSTDNGMTWAAADTMSSASKLTFHGNTILASDGPWEVRRSVDAGATWRPSAVQPLTKQVNGFFSSPRAVFCGTQGGGVYYSSDSGDSWAQLGLGSILTRDVKGLTQVGDYLYAVTNYYIPADSRYQCELWRYSLSN